jgi:protein TonB
MKQKRRFKLWHGFAAAIALHAMLGLLFAAGLVAVPPDEPPLVIELQGVASDSPDLAEVKQSEIDQKKAEAKQSKPDTPDPAKNSPPQQATRSDDPPMEVAANEEASHDPPQPAPTPPAREVKTPPPAPEAKAAPDDSNVKGANEYVPPSRAQVEITEKDYSALLMKKVRDHLVYPDEAKRARLQGVATVSFVILSNGDLRPETLKVVKSSGEPTLDISALHTIRASAPFAPPPREMAVSIGVAFGPKR